MQATIANIQNTLHITLTYHTFLGREFFTQEETSTLPGSVASLVQSIVGLDNFAFPEFKPPFSAAQGAKLGAADCTNYGAQQTLTRNQLAAERYRDQPALPAGISGSGHDNRRGRV